MYSLRIAALFAVFLLAKAGKKGATVRVILKPPVILEEDAAGYKTTYACEGKVLTLECDEGTLHLVRANFGRFSISICNDNGNLDWRVNCMSHHSFLIMRERCELRSSCSVNVSSETFHDPCPGTLKYLEVQYHCGTGPLPTTSSTTPLQGLKASLPTSNVTAIPIGKIHTVTQRSTTTSIPPTSPIPLLRTSTTSLPNTVPSTMAVANESQGIFEHSELSTSSTTKVSATDAVPTIATLPKMNFTTEQPTSALTTEMYDENSCHPIESRGIHWPAVKAGEAVTSQCPDGAGGSSQWHCMENPVQWSPDYPDLTQCYSLWLEKLKDRIQNGDSIISAVSELAVMSAAKPVYSRDLKDISDVIEKAFYKSLNNKDNFLDMWHRYHVLRELLTFSVQTLNNLLDSKQEIAWKELQLEDAKKVISTFLEKIDTSALLLSETSSDDSRFSLVKKNIWLSLQVLKAKSYDTVIFPIFSDISAEEDREHWLDMKDSLLLPHDAIESFEKNGYYKVVYIAFNKLHNLLKPGFNDSRSPSSENVSRIINSRIIGASLDKNGDVKLNQPAVITLKHLIEINVSNPVCVFWDIQLKDWSTEGCTVESSNQSHTVCLCDHLTNFALMMDLKTVSVSTPNTHWMYTIIASGCGIAIVSLTIAVLILFFRISLNLSEDSIFIHRNMCLCLLLSEVVFVVGIKQTRFRIPCSLIAGSIQYLLLATFCWMLFECFHQYLSLIQSCDTKKSKSWCYYVSAYTVPCIIIGISAMIDPSSYGTKQFCWLQTDNYFVFSFVGPAVSFVFGGLVFLCIALFLLYHNVPSETAVKETDYANLLKFRSWNRRSMLLIVVLSITWASALVYMTAETIILAYTFAILNSVQGVAILSMYCLQNDKVKEEIRNILPLQWFFKQRKRDEPHTEPTENMDPGNSSMETDAREFWTLPKENISASSSNVTKDSASVLARSSLNNIHENNSLQNSPWISKGTSTRRHKCYVGKKCNGEQDSVSLHVRRHHPSSVKDQGRKYFGPPDSNGEFSDHIYETIDDNALPDEDESSISYQAGQRFPLPLENYFSDQSQPCQYSSSSCGLDGQHVLSMDLQTGQSLSRIPYPISKDNPMSQHSDGAEQTREQMHTFRRHRSPSENPMGLRVASERSHNFSSENQVFSEEMSPNHWEPAFPDLIQSPPDNSVVLAVLDGDKVVNRIQQDDVLIKPQYKLSTYC